MPQDASAHPPIAEPRPQPFASRRPGFSRASTRVVLAVMALLAAVALAVVLVATPFVLSLYSGATGLDWNRLGAVGETYGAAATVLTALSLAAIAASLVVQALQARVAREQAARTFHMDLVRMKLEDTDFLWAAGWPRPELRTPEERTSPRIRQHLYANLWIYYWLMRFEIGQLNEANLRALLEREFFNGEVGRDYWASSGSTFTVMHSRTQRRFFGIVEEEYRKAVASPRPPVPATGPRPEDHTVRRRPRPSPKALGVAGAALAVAVAGGAAARAAVRAGSGRPRANASGTRRRRARGRTAPARPRR